MNVLFVTLAVWVVAFVVHLVWWRVWLPKHQLITLLALFGVFFLAATLAAVLFPSWLELGADGGWVLLGWAYFGLLYWALAFCYVITYSAMEGDSPTLSLARELALRADGGMSREEIAEFFALRPFIGARIGALVKDGVLVPEEGGYRLAPGNYHFFRLILGYRRIAFGKIKDGG